VVFFVASVFGTTALVNALFGGSYYEEHGWPKILMSVIAGTPSSGARSRNLRGVR